LKWFTEVRQMHKGAAFGEIALINNAPRSANVTAVQDCQFAILSRNDYDKVIKKCEIK